MICPKCNAECIDGSTFCIKCGANLKEISNESVVPTQESSEQSVSVQVEQPVVQQSYNNAINNIQTNNNMSNVSMNYLMYAIAVLLKPFKCFKEEENKFNNPKTTIIFSLVISVIMMLVTLFKSMLSVIFTKTMDYSTYKMKTTLDFSNLKDLDYLSLIGKNLLIYIGIILAITSIYYIVSLIFKKTVSYIKLLSITTTSIIPFIVSGMIISPLLGKLWVPLSIVFMVAGISYSIIIFIHLINDNISFDNNDIRIYFHLICMTIIGTIGYYVYANLIIESVSTQISSLLDYFE